MSVIRDLKQSANKAHCLVYPSQQKEVRSRIFKLIGWTCLASVAVNCERLKKFGFTVLRHSSCFESHELFRIMRVSTCMDGATSSSGEVLGEVNGVTQTKVHHRWTRDKRILQ